MAGPQSLDSPLKTHMNQILPYREGKILQKKKNGIKYFQMI